MGWIILTILCCLIALVWASRHLQISRQHRSTMVVRGLPVDDRSDWPTVSVLVAAKDEEDNIATCIESVLMQDYPDFELVVIDDRSEDRTAEIAARYAEDDGRVTLVRIDELPEDWAGKNHAMHTGIRHARGDWLCMIDADCTQKTPHTLAAAVAKADELDADLLSVLPEMELRTFWENVVQPVCSGVMMIWCHPDKVNNPRKPQVYANGAFILMTRTAYDRVGGHGPIRDRIQDDLWLARLTKRAGLRLRVAPGVGLYGVRMYTSLRAIVGGWTRIFLGTFGKTSRIIASMLLVLFMSLLPYAVAAAGWITWALAGGSEALTAAVVATVAVGLQWSVLWRFYSLLGGRRGLFWTYPLGCLIALKCLGTALWKLVTGSTVTWRGTTYEAASVGAPGVSDETSAS
jgi:glycosyltransferase involved in cell wall biosynthesis